MAARVMLRHNVFPGDVYECPASGSCFYVDTVGADERVSLAPIAPLYDEAGRVETSIDGLREYRLLERNSAARVSRGLTVPSSEVLH